MLGQIVFSYELLQFRNSLKVSDLTSKLIAVVRKKLCDIEASTNGA